MNEGEAPSGEAATPNDSSGDEGEAVLKKKLKSKKKKAGKLKDESMKSASSNETSSKKPSTSKPRRTKNANDADVVGKPSSRRKSAETTRKESSLNVLSKTANRRGSKSVADENSAKSAGSVDSRSHSIGARRGERTRSPNRDNNDKKKGSTNSGGRRRSGSSQQQPEGFDPEASAMWDVPSFGAGADDPSGNLEAADFVSAFDGGAGGFNDFNPANFAFTPHNPLDGDAPATAASPPQSYFDAGGVADSDPFVENVFGNSSPRDSLETAPQVDPPRRKIGKLTLVKRRAFSQQFACPPVRNPLTGNIIFCTSRDGNMHIQEVDPRRRYVQVVSSPILTAELHKKVTTKYSRSAYGVDNVLKLCVGMHQSHGQPRVRVVACVDLLVLDSKHILRAIGVWQWGYGSSQLVSLQFLLSPPSGTDYAYDPELVLVADNIVFVAGASAKGPCVFMCKPSLRESWSANFLAPSGKITSMAVTASTKTPYLAVGMADGSLSVWTYAAALKQATSKKSEPFRRLLYPLCRLDAVWVLNSVQPTNFADENRQNPGGE